MVGKLDRATYGTRDALAAWQAELEKTMIELGFRPVESAFLLVLSSVVGNSCCGLWMI